jgi:hypothetical protein
MSTMKSNTPSSATDAVETAVPLIQKNDYDSSQTEQPPEIKEQSSYMPVIHFLSAGICIGMVLSGIVYGSIEIVLNQYGENPTLQGALDHVVYGLLWLGTHIVDLSYAMICVVCAFLLTQNGSKLFQGLKNEYTDDFWHNARSVFLGGIYFEVGFVLGSILMGFDVTFLRLNLDILVCCLFLGHVMTGNFRS